MEGSDSGLADLFARDSDSEDDDSNQIRYEDIGGVRYQLRCAHNDGSSPGALFAYTVWSGSVQIAEYLAAHPDIVAGKRVVEVGAAAALPSLAALSLGASRCLITDYPSDHILAAIRVNVTANATQIGLTGTHWEQQSADGGRGADNAAAAALNGTDGESACDSERCLVEGHLWGSPLPEKYVEAFDVCIIAECLWNHAQHPALLKSVSTFLRPGGVALLSYAHHIPGCEAADDAFFACAASPSFGLDVDAELLEQRPMRYMWDADKTTEQMLCRMTKPAAPRTVTENLQPETAAVVVPSAIAIEKGSIGPEVETSYAAVLGASSVDEVAASADFQEGGGAGVGGSIAPASPHDSASLAAEMRRRASVISRDEDAARQAPLTIPRDKAGRALPMTLPGPRAPRHEDHPAFGMKVWPPPRPTVEEKPPPSWAAEEKSLPDWVQES
eukprot:CAMPEP_0171923402 /NCGR_PEP_ID=MMETSP0993-20121228/22086_1 /TAXON_ID=483369 /ORGANISM="non described non described, Strain CCMP2098" /LENGTH=443 /DNA_ID=CAMNT_0012561403 /DNA_START=64 /DNA_END=1395 /DNA_ORIENTATION=+